MRIISFNVNGVRSMAGKNKSGQKLAEPKEASVLTALVEEQKPDILCQPAPDPLDAPPGRARHAHIGRRPGREFDAL
jgi:hypothetical protein